MVQKNPNYLFKKLFYRYTLIIVGVVLVLVIYFISESKSGILETNQDYLRMMAEKASGYLEDCSKEVDYIHADLYQSREIHSDLLAYFRYTEEEYQKYRLNTYASSQSQSYKGFDGFFEETMKAYPEIISIEVICYNKDEVTICYPDGKTYVRENGADRMRDVESGSLASGEVFSFVKEIRDPDTMLGEGCMIVSFPAEEFKDIQNYYATADLLIFNNREAVIYTSDESLNTADFFRMRDTGEDADFLNAYVQKSEVGNYTAYGYLKRYRAARIPWALFFTILGCGLAVILAGVFCIRYYLTNLEKRIGRIIAGMHQLTMGDMNVRLQSEKNGDELDVIAEQFNEMCRELDRYIQKSYLAEIEQKNAEMEVLQSQINPHFLYNTLEAIRMKAICNGDREVGKMLYSMAVIFRSQLKEADMIPLVQEIHYCKKYLELFEYRYQDKFSSTVECPEEMMELKVMKFLLQPVIENYFVHGIRGEQEGNYIHIWAEREGGNLLIHVEDNGRGMDEDLMAAKNEELERNASADRKSIGITNVNRRIRAIYGQEYGLRLEKSSLGGMHVILKTGIREEDTYEESNAGGR